MTKQLKFWQLNQFLSEGNIEKSLKPHMKNIDIILSMQENFEDFSEREAYILKLLNEIIIPDCVPEEYRKTAHDKVAGASFEHFYNKTKSVIYTKIDIKNLYDLLSDGNIKKALKPYMNIIVRTLSIMDEDDMEDNDFEYKKLKYIDMLLDEIIVPKCVPKRYRSAASVRIYHDDPTIYQITVLDIIDEKYKQYLARKEDEMF